MSITYFVELNNINWVDVSQGNLAGFMTNKSDNDILYLQSEDLPDSSLKEGHTLHPKSYVRFAVVEPVLVFARSIQLSCKLTVTPG